VSALIPERLERLLSGQITLAKGDHQSPDAGLCVVEAAAWIAGEEHSDHPACVCPVVASFARRLNDRLPDDRRQALVPLIPLLVGTAGSTALRRRRAYRCADWAVREVAPRALRAAGLDEQAARLEALAPITDGATARAATTVARAAAAAAYAAAAAADATAAYAAAAAADATAAYATGAAAYAAAAPEQAIALLRELCEMRDEQEVQS
jgi:hypothetical protein